MVAFKDNPSFSKSRKKFNVILLAAGVGSRLRPITDYLPKPLIEVIPGVRVIDHIIRKYQNIADRIIIATAHKVDLFEYYVQGKYPELKIIFSKEREEELKSPGRSLTLALDHVSPELPTLITFCDYLLEDQIDVESDCLCLCNPKKGNYVLDILKSKGVIKNGFVIRMIENPDLKDRQDGFTGLGVFYNTLLLKKIANDTAKRKGLDNVDYTFDVVQEYLSKVKTKVQPYSRQYEFGNHEHLKRIREIFENV
ncbi:hypothetical protein A3K72_01090 [Candidatus Woesearchaeota archaeon RBG_13_36_6]|nr:MAG: hypothetical protein A3K72_01090 [Candidatus Woesearchaeota archaeon RBG_13_36_6]